MRLNLLFGVPVPEKEPECGGPSIRTHPKSGAKHPGDPRSKLSATRAISDEYFHSYKVNSSDDQFVPKTPADTMNPDVSGFTSRLCKTPPRNTKAGDESFGAALSELSSGKRR
jgi:hypothetical protein